MKRVSTEDFYLVLNPLNVVPRVTNNRWPYTTDFRMADNPNGPIIGRAVGRADPANPGWDYFLPERGRA